LIEDRPDLRVEVIRIGATEPSRFDSDVTHVMTSGGDSYAAAAAMSQFDVAVVQHEFGIYDGDDGEAVLDIVAATRVPVVVVAHTVPAKPTANQRRILESLARAADTVVTLSGAGRRRLMDSYQVDPRKLVLIPHGAPAAAPRPQASAGPGLAVLTWGLLGPGKGVEWGISALAEMDTDRFQPMYTVAGQTHPKVLARDGERYRDSLTERAERHGVSRRVRFEPGYVSDDRLRELLSEADVVLLPYDSHEQVTSGVLTEAIAAGIPVVSTAFPHAVELLADGRGGLLVPHRDPVAIAAALTRIAAEPDLARAMSEHNASWKTLVSWPAVARQYGQILDRLSCLSPRPIR
jgi:glycosyltransferase involved in cell wall biosynthesis